MASVSGSVTVCSAGQLSLVSTLDLELAKPFTRGRLLAGAAPHIAAGPLAKLAFAEDDPATHADHMRLASHAGHTQHKLGHAAMIGVQAPAVGGPFDLDALLYPPPALGHSPGRVREYTLTAVDKE